MPPSKERIYTRYYEIAGITIRVVSPIPIEDNTFHSRFKIFEVDVPGEDTVSIRHHFSLPDLRLWDLTEAVYRRPPWAIYRNGNTWVYVGRSSFERDTSIYGVAVFNKEAHDKADIYHPTETYFRQGGIPSLTLLPSDQILLARVLAARGGCYFHSGGVIFGEKGLLFVGHANTGKSTLVRMLSGKAEILSDDRIIVRRRPEGFRIHGTWNYGEVPTVSASGAPLRAVFFLKRDMANCVTQIDDRKESTRKLLGRLIRPLTTADWWVNMLTLVEGIIEEVPCYNLSFDRSGRIIDLLKDA
jgi:hypothetical protein